MVPMPETERVLSIHLDSLSCFLFRMSSSSKDDRLCSPSDNSNESDDSVDYSIVNTGEVSSGTHYLKCTIAAEAQLVIENEPRNPPNHLLPAIAAAAQLEAEDDYRLLPVVMDPPIWVRDYYQYPSVVMQFGPLITPIIRPASAISVQEVGNDELREEHQVGDVLTLLRDSPSKNYLRDDGPCVENKAVVGQR